MKNKKVIWLSLTLFTLLLMYVGTYAYYMKVVNGTITGKTGAFTFDVLHNSEKFTSIDLYDTMENPSLTSKYIIPGDSGMFELTAIANGSSTDVEYEITFTGTNIPTNLKFYLNKQKTNKLDLTNSIKGYFNSDDTDKTKVYTIYWEWPYDSGVNNSDDINYQNKDILLDITITGKQSPGHAIMMNGDLHEHSNKTTTVGMWKDEYRLKIKNITFSNDLSNLPSSCTEANLCWDITDSESIYPVYHYLVQNEADTTKYDAYIVSEEKIYAPKDSSGIFELCGEESGSYVSYVETINFNNNFDTSKVTNMGDMFAALTRLKSVDVSNFNTVNVTNMLQLFYGCKALEVVDVSNFDTSNVTTMEAMFQGSAALKTLDLSNFDTSKVTNMRVMFGGTSASGDMHLKEIKVSDKFVTDNVTDMLEMFRLCRYLNFTFNVTGNKVTNYTNIFLNTATDSNAKIVVNYTAETETLVDNMLATKSSNSNVVKGSQI